MPRRPTNPKASSAAVLDGSTDGIEYAEHVAATERFGTAVRFALPMWLAAIALDLALGMSFAPARLHWLLALRGAGALPLLLAIWRLHVGGRPRPVVLRTMTAGLCGWESACFSIMGIVSSGVTSAYFGGVLLTLIFCGVLVSEPWRRGAVIAAAPLVAYPFTVATSSLFSPLVAAQLQAASGRATVFANLCNLAFAYLVVVIAGHATWALRRQVFATRHLGRYKLKRRIGSGGMGEVWVAHHTALKRDVAIKILRSTRGAEEEAVRRFEREVQATTELHHPNTIRVFDYGSTEDGLRYYAMELLEGENLASRVERLGALPVRLAVTLTLQAARSLAEAHDKGIVHRDIKPENLFVTRPGGNEDFVKVLDFGIAKVTGDLIEQQRTQTGMLLGTPAWMAPETLARGSADARSDVYQLGAVLYLLLTAKPPHRPEAGSDRLFAVLPPSSVRGAPIPSVLEELVLRCLALDPLERFPSASELAEALAALELPAEEPMVPAPSDGWSPAPTSVELAETERRWR